MWKSDMGFLLIVIRSLSSACTDWPRGDHAVYLGSQLIAPNADKALLTTLENYAKLLWWITLNNYCLDEQSWKLPDSQSSLASHRLTSVLKFSENWTHFVQMSWRKSILKQSVCRIQWQAISPIGVKNWPSNIEHCLTSSLIEYKEHQKVHMKM